MKGLLIFLTVCAFTAAMVPRERRAMNEEDEVHETETTAPVTTTPKPKEICAPQTPCAWSMYQPITKIIETNITNSYCNCGVGTVCSMQEDDTAISTYVYRCRPPSDDDEVIDS